MSHALYRMGRFAARRPWVVIGAWLLVPITVIGASAVFGRDLSDSTRVPGLDSQEAVDLLSATQSDRAGLTAQVVMTPVDDEATFLDSAAAQAALVDVEGALAALPNVLAVSDPAAISPDGRVALVRVQYPVIEELSVGDLENLKAFAVDVRPDSPLHIEMGGDLFFAFEQPETGIGEAIGLIVAVVVLLLAFGSLIAMGLPIAVALFGIALGVSSMALITYLVEIPSWAP